MPYKFSPVSAHLFTCACVVFKLCTIKHEMRPLCSPTVVPLNLPPCDLSQSSDVRNRQKEASPTGLQWRRYIWNVFLSQNYFRKLMSSAHNGEKRICQTKDLLSRRGGLEAFVIFFLFFFHPASLWRTDTRHQHDEEMVVANWAM